MKVDSFFSLGRSAARALRGTHTHTASGGRTDGALSLSDRAGMFAWAAAAETQN